MTSFLKSPQPLVIAINTDENWDYHETSLKVAEIFDKRDEMKDALDRMDAKEVFLPKMLSQRFLLPKAFYSHICFVDALESKIGYSL